MRNRDDKDDIARRRSIDEDEDEPNSELLGMRTDLTSNLRPDYSWIQHFQSMHSGWQFLHFEDIPWTPLQKDLSSCKLAYISLAGAYAKGQKPFNIAPSAVSDVLRRQRFKTRGDWSFREIAHNTAPADLKVAHAYYDHTDADEDINCVFPLERLVELEYENVIGSIHNAHFSLMGFVPEWQLIENSAAKQIGDKLQKAQVDAVFLSPGCILGHQNMAIIQRRLEARGIPTLSLTQCADITEHIGVPRAVSLRFPLGNTFGAALDNMTQYRILRDALTAFEEIQEPGVIIELPYEWVKNA
jgi:D-proline reductase (dithiol) PrdB